MPFYFLSAMKEKQQLLADAGQAINRRDFVAAHRACVTVIQQFGDDAKAYFLLGVIHIELMQIQKAIQLLDKSNRLSPEPQTYVYLAKCYSLLGDMVSAVTAAGQAPVKMLSRALDMDTVGVALSRVGLHEKALAYFEQALVLTPDNPQFHYNYAVSSKFSGLFELARSHFEKAIQLAPLFYQAHFALSDLGGVNAEKNHIARLLSAREATSNQVDAQLHLGHALAKEYEALNDYDAAFAALSKAKALKQPEVAGFEQYSQAMFDYLMQRQRNPQSGGNASQQPVFVLGMPRSGTTLVERIISNHSDVASGGELQDFGVAVKMLAQTASKQVLDLETLQQAENIDMKVLGDTYLARTSFLLQGKKKLVDKLPFNFFYVDLIRRALPNAKIVCLLRDPMDTCIGNFRQLFSINSPYYAYAYDLMAIGRFYQRFFALVQYWQQQHPDAVRLQSYEALVQNPTEQIPEMLNFCGLDMQPQCLHAEQNKAPVSTASKVQVREAINTRSIGRWRQYERHTKDLQALFTPN